MISVEEAQAHCLDLVSRLEPETVPLDDAAGRVLASPVTASRPQPPFAASAMDGYALRGSEARVGASFRVVGEAAAGHVWQGRLAQGEALRIFTGAPVPEGADRVVIQEDVTRDGDRITLQDCLEKTLNIRPQAADFDTGFVFQPKQRLRAPDLALLAAMNAGTLSVTRRPRIAIVSTGDELVLPGGVPRPDQILASNIYALKAMVEDAGGTARLLPIAADTVPALTRTLQDAQDADLVVTVGGASVGDHDLVAGVAQSLGLQPAFYKIAMRPGKPLMAGRFPGPAFLGLPGNPVSAIVCGTLFLLPMLRRMLGLPDPLPRIHHALLAGPVAANGPRTHYMRAHVQNGAITAFERQDSALLTVMQAANALLIRPLGDPERTAGDAVDYIPL